MPLISLPARSLHPNLARQGSARPVVAGFVPRKLNPHSDACAIAMPCV